MSDTESSPLETLLAVQELDTRADQARHRRDHGPLVEAVQDAERTSRQAGVALAGATQARDEVAKDQAQLEVELETVEKRVKEIDQRMYSGQVSASRDLQALSAEAASLRSRGSDLEDQALEVLERLEPLEAAVDQASSGVADADSSLQQARAALDREVGEIDAALAALGEEREAKASAIPAELLATYDSLRRRLGGVGAARLVGNRCSGCHLVLPAQELDHLRHLAPGEVATCEECERILVPGPGAA